MANQDFNPPEEGESIVIDLNEAPEGTEKAAAPAGSKPPPVPGPGVAPAAPQTGLEDLQKQINAERAERARVTQVAQQIARERDQAMQLAQEAESKGVTTYELYNENQIKATTDRMEALSEQAEQAMQDGDFKRAQNLNLQIGRLGGNLAVLERDQVVLQQQRQPQQPQQRQQPQQPQQPQLPTDPLERAIHNRTEPTKQFLRKHPDLVRNDGSLKRTAIDAHDRALDAGYTVDTPGYFDYIENSLRANTPGQQAPGGVPLRGAPTMAAPVDRGPSPGSANGSGTFVMTPKMRRLAEEQNVEPREWARNYVRLLAEGRITPIT